METQAEIAPSLAVVRQRLGLTLAQQAVSRKSGEVRALRSLFQALTLTGLVVTMDAQFTQRDLAQTICDRQGHYLMRVKENQPTLWDEVEALFAPQQDERARRESTTTWERGHGRIEERTVVVIALRPDEVPWPGARQRFRLYTNVLTKQRQQVEESWHYGIPRLGPEEADAARLLQLNRYPFTEVGAGEAEELSRKGTRLPQSRPAGVQEELADD